MKKLEFDDIFGSRSSSKGVSLITKIDKKEENKSKLEDIDYDKPIPVLPIRGLMLFPTVIMPVSIGRSSSLKLVREAEKSGRLFAACTQIDDAADFPEYDDMYKIGVLARVVKFIRIPTGDRIALIEGLQRIKLKSMEEGSSYYTGKVEPYPEEECDNKQELKVVTQACREIADDIFKSSDRTMQLAFTLDNLSTEEQIINFVCGNVQVNNGERFRMLEKDKLADRATRLLKILQQERQLMDLKQEIQERTRMELDKQQKNYFLRQEMEHIREELGEKGDNNSAQTDRDKLRVQS